MVLCVFKDESGTWCVFLACEDEKHWTKVGSEACSVHYSFFTFLAFFFFHFLLSLYLFRIKKNLCSQFALSSTQSCYILRNNLLFVNHLRNAWPYLRSVSDAWRIRKYNTRKSKVQLYFLHSFTTLFITQLLANAYVCRKILQRQVQGFDKLKVCGWTYVVDQDEAGPIKHTISRDHFY